MVFISHEYFAELVQKIDFPLILTMARVGKFLLLSLMWIFYFIFKEIACEGKSNDQKKYTNQILRNSCRAFIKR